MIYFNRMTKADKEALELELGRKMTPNDRATFLSRKSWEALKNSQAYKDRQEIEMAKAGVTASEILANIIKKKQSAGVELVTNPTEFYSVWVKQQHLKYPNMECIAPFTVVQKKFAKQMIELWGEYTSNCSKMVLVCVIDHWHGFTKVVEADTEAFKSPQTPSLAYLYKYRGNAYNFWSSRKHLTPVLYCPDTKKVIQTNTVAQTEKLNAIEKAKAKSVYEAAKENASPIEHIEAVMAKYLKPK